ncbi:MAG: alpha/beta fold hydrolase [Thermoguttaceae bacterium]|nr:alpha/beta fold hydrolase [Thermoguttaceae bacterium]
MRASDSPVESNPQLGPSADFRSNSSNAQAGAKNHEPVLLFFYGNGACLAWCDHLMQCLCKMGVTAAVVEYVGYGVSSGKPSERLCYESAEAAYRYWVEQAGVSPDRIIVVGHSLGAAVACDLASRKPVGKLIMLSGFTTLTDAARIHFPWLPVRMLLFSRFDSSSKIPHVKADILFLHGEKDQIVPVEMSRKNFAIAQARMVESKQEIRQDSNGKNSSRLIVFPTANHNLLEEIPEKVYAEIEDFIIFPKKDESSPLKKNGNRVN